MICLAAAIRPPATAPLGVEDQVVVYCTVKDQSPAATSPALTSLFTNSTVVPARAWPRLPILAPPRC